MGITDAFRNLNSSIRGIRNDRDRHAEKMRSLELEDAKLTEQLNDPRNIRAKQLAQKDIEVGAFGSLYNKSAGSAFTPAMDTELTTQLNNVVAPEGHEFREGTLYKKDTNDKSMFPNHQNRDLRAKSTAVMMGVMSPEKTLNAQISGLDSRIEDRELGLKEYPEGSPVRKMLDTKLKEDVNTRKTLVGKRDDPKEQIRRHGSYREHISNMANSLMEAGIIDSKLFITLGNLSDDSYREEQMIRKGVKDKEDTGLGSLKDGSTFKIGYKQEVQAFQDDPKGQGIPVPNPSERQKLEAQTKNGMVKIVDGEYVRAKNVAEYRTTEYAPKTERQKKSIPGDITPKTKLAGIEKLLKNAPYGFDGQPTVDKYNEVYGREKKAGNKDAGEVARKAAMKQYDKDMDEFMGVSRRSDTEWDSINKEISDRKTGKKKGWLERMFGGDDDKKSGKNNMDNLLY